MPTFVYLLNWTEKGLQESRNTVDKTATLVENIEHLGVRIFETYWTSGVYDLVLVAECPDEDTAHAVALDMQSRGNVRATSLRAFDSHEMRSIFKTLGWGG